MNAESPNISAPQPRSARVALESRPVIRQLDDTSANRIAAGEVVEGNLKEIKRQRDIWTFARTMGSADPNWQLVATGD